MSIDRLWQAGAEWASPAMEFTSHDTNFVASGTQAKTGSYSFRTEDTDYATVNIETQYNVSLLATPSSVTQLRVGFWVYNAGGAATELPRLISFRAGATETLQLRWDEDNSLFKFYDGVGGSVLDSGAAASFASGGSWVHIGVDVKISASGWAYLYVNGAEVIGFDGDTTGTGSTIDTVLFGGVDDNWNQYIYYDDLWIDLTTSEAIPAFAPAYGFLLAKPNAQGVWNDWTGSDGDSTDNYALLDDVPSSDGTNYIEADTTTMVDSSELTAPTVTSYSVSAVYIHAFAKVGAAVGLDLRMYVRDSSTSAFGYSSNMVVGTTYQPVFQEKTTSINSLTWDQTEINNLEIGVATL